LRAADRSTALGGDTVLCALPAFTAQSASAHDSHLW